MEKEKQKLVETRIILKEKEGNNITIPGTTRTMNNQKEHLCGHQYIDVDIHSILLNLEIKRQKANTTLSAISRGKACQWNDKNIHSTIAWSKGMRKRNC